MQSSLKLALAAALLGAVVVPSAFAQSANVSSGDENALSLDAQAKASWRDDVAQAVPTDGGCYHASYPSIVWQPVACHQLTPRAIPVPRKPAAFGHAQTVGNGNDYTLNTTSPISKAVGSFTTYTGVTSEKGVGVAAFGGSGILGANEYTLQMNTSFNSTTAACKGHSGCTVWQQFIYATDYETQGEGAVFMQDWLIGYGGSSCPSGFGSDGEGDCYKNSSAATIPDISPKSLGSVTLTGTATTGGNDTTVVSYDGEAYTASQKDSTLDIASVWNEAEYNVVGDAGGSEAEFNKGVTIGVKVAATDGSTAAPSCEADTGTTGETNNLTAGKCTATGGSTPSISFTESD